ncbi:unnamed protein product [Cuscuta epithymum]|uniref:Uncharacterized protein n=1 Tax=Cuscuta epithymum TaxID=186058 RepID=A0AAV0BYK9_9ASTE|nr:unnamed protein product [Cuscuta epithymum]
MLVYFEYNVSYGVFGTASASASASFLIAEAESESVFRNWYLPASKKTDSESKLALQKCFWNFNQTLQLLLLLPEGAESVLRIRSKHPLTLYNALYKTKSRRRMGEISHPKSRVKKGSPVGSCGRVWHAHESVCNMSNL